MRTWEPNEDYILCVRSLYVIKGLKTFIEENLKCLGASLEVPFGGTLKK